MLVMNKHKQYGSPDSLPFDLRYRRFPLTFELGPQSERRQQVIDSLVSELEGAIRTCLAAEYDRAAKEVEDADLKKLLIRIRDNELYHVDVFSDLLKDEEK